MTVECDKYHGVKSPDGSWSSELVIQCDVQNEKWVTPVTKKCQGRKMTYCTLPWTGYGTLCISVFPPHVWGTLETDLSRFSSVHSCQGTAYSVSLHCILGEYYWIWETLKKRYTGTFSLITQAKLSAINPIWNRYKSYVGFPCNSYIENGKPGIRADFLYRICIGENFK
jgi:hypothetical protein